VAFVWDDSGSMANYRHSIYQPNAGPDPHQLARNAGIAAYVQGENAWPDLVKQFPESFAIIATTKLGIGNENDGTGSLAFGQALGGLFQGFLGMAAIAVARVFIQRRQ